MDMHVNKPRREDQPPGVYFFAAFSSDPGGDFRDSPLLDSEIGHFVELLGRINDGALSENQIHS
jgi:hypothetical protein